ncbi:MAG: ribonuclease PH [Chloroflexota bacterium]|nr:ribonuclease PH [Chloroflexota bacterium]
MKRIDGRKHDQLRNVALTPDYVIYPEGSVLIAMGKTKVLCNATVEDQVPYWMKKQGRAGGWVTAEYALLPRSTQERTSRETRGLRGRTQEIKRMIARSLRAAVDLTALGKRMCILDCDVLQADGGTRTAAITGGYIALRMAIQTLVDEGEVSPHVFLPPVAAISVGVVDDQPMLDLCYSEDFNADADVNIVMNAAGEFIEVQGTAEGATFDRATFNAMLDLADKGIRELLTIQESVFSRSNLSP